MDLQQEVLAKFLAHYGDDDAARNDLGDFLRGNHEFVAPTDRIPVLEYAERLDLARRIRATVRTIVFQFELSMAMFSAIMLAPIQDLRAILNPPPGHYSPPTSILAPLDYICPLLRAFFRGPGPASTPSVGSSRSSGRSSTERRKALRRDGNRCIVTGAACPHVCHIIPFSWSESAKNCAIIQRCFGFLGEFLWTGEALPRDLYDCLWGAPGAADKCWNMLSLSPLLHTWWGNAFFGFKFLGQLPTEQPGTANAMVPIQLQFRWMPRRAVQPTATIMLDEQDDYDTCFVSGFHGHSQDVSTMARFNQSGQLVRSGHVFTIRISEQDAPKFIAVINIQWALIQLGAMCAFAEANDDDDDYDDGGQASAEPVDVDAWIEGVVVGEDLSP